MEVVNHHKDDDTVAYVVMQKLHQDDVVAAGAVNHQYGHQIQHETDEGYNPSCKRVKKTSVLFNNYDHFKDAGISELPEDIKIFILSLVPIQDVLRTSVLSKQWRYLWTQVPCLEFDWVERILEARRLVYMSNGEPFDLMDDTVYEAYKREMFQHTTFRKLAAQVNQAVKIHSRVGVSKLEKFRVRLSPASNNYVELKEVNEWVNFAFDKNVEILELDLTFSFFIECRYLAPFAKVSFGRICSHKVFKSSSSSCLRVVCLRGVNVSGEVLEFFLVNCKGLEELSVANSESLKSLRVGGGCGDQLVSSCRLKKLEIIYCRNLDYIEVEAENLTGFKLLRNTLDRRSFNIIYSSATSLVNLCVSYHLFRYMCSVSRPKSRNVMLQLKMLTLDVYEREKLGLNKLPVLRNLKILCLRINASTDEDIRLADDSLFLACPSLEEIKLELSVCSILERRNYPPNFLHFRRGQITLEHLKVITIIGWIGSYYDTKVVSYIVDMSKSLKQITFDARLPSSVAKCHVEITPRNLTSILLKAKAFADKILSPGVQVNLLPMCCLSESQRLI